MKGLRFVTKRRNGDEYSTLLEEERLILEATELVHRLMQDQSVSRAELARRVGVSKGHVTQLLDGSRNMTLRTLARLTHALNRRLQLDAQPLARQPQVPQPVLARTLDAYVKCVRASGPTNALVSRPPTGSRRIGVFSAKDHLIVSLAHHPKDLDEEFADLLAGAA
jgi:transcriptional regulator with XRE-family HTH domain